MTQDGQLTAIDCFAGAGGLSCGLVDAGFAIRAAFDIVPEALETYRHNIGDHTLNSRIEDLSGSELVAFAGLNEGECDLVVGGPPCQGFSRQRRGSDQDVRNDLVLQFMRLVSEIVPTMFLMENVSALQGPRGRPHLNECLNLAKQAGYRTHVRILDAAEYGVPQHRRRLFVVGEIDDGGAYFRFPAPTHSREHFRTVRDAIGDLPSPLTSSVEAAMFANHELDNISELNRKRISHVPEGGGRADIPEELQLPCHRVSVEKAGHRGVYGRLEWDKPAGTITTKCNSFTRGRFAHPTENRNISMREAARLQGFPDQFVFHGSKVPVAHQIGNSVPPPLARCLGLALKEAMDARLAKRHLTGPQLTLDFGVEDER